MGAQVSKPHQRPQSISEHPGVSKLVLQIRIFMAYPPAIGIKIFADRPAVCPAGFPAGHRDVQAAN